MTADWVLTTVDGKVAGAATDFRVAAEITGRIARLPVRETAEIISRKVSTAELQEMSRVLKWSDLRLFGSAFQRKVWKALFRLTHPEDPAFAADSATAIDSASAADGVASGSATAIEVGAEATGHENALLSSKLYSYTAFARRCGNIAGVRAVAHAVGLNPIGIIIPCHLIVPKESIVRLREIETQAASTLFARDIAPMASNINFGEYRCGRAMKRRLILDLLD